ncbi:MAG: hypothetical protein U0835_00360 [Isosphaeraceae bacterium]
MTYFAQPLLQELEAARAQASKESSTLKEFSREISTWNKAIAIVRRRQAELPSTQEDWQQVLDDAVAYRRLMAARVSGQHAAKSIDRQDLWDALIRLFGGGVKAVETTLCVIVVIEPFLCSIPCKNFGRAPSSTPDAETGPVKPKAHPWIGSTTSTVLIPDDDLKTKLDESMSAAVKQTNAWPSYKRRSMGMPSVRVSNPQPANGSDRLVENLAMLVRRMAYSLSLSDKGRKLAEQANDFLIRNGLQGSPLRSENEDKEPTP